MGRIICEDTTKMTTKEWEAARQHGPNGDIPVTLGGSDAGAVIHELVHVIQAYPTYVPWITESIADYMKGQNIPVSVPTVIKYIGYLKEAYVIDDIPLYSPKAKAKLNYYYKLFDEDVSFNSIRVSGNRFDLTHNLENIVLNELIYMGYEVTVYQNKGREIDFRAVRDGKIYLVQVAYSVAEDKAYEREFSAFADIDNTVKKIIITNDDIDYSTSTVYHYKLRDFLMKESL